MSDGRFIAIGLLQVFLGPSARFLRHRADYCRISEMFSVNINKKKRLIRIIRISHLCLFMVLLHNYISVTCGNS